MSKNEKRKGIILNGADIKDLPKKERLAKTFTSTSVLVLSGLGGGFIGAATGRWSLLTGILVAGAGQFTGVHAATAFGLGMATSNIVSGGAPVSGTDDKKGMALVKERLKNYGQGLKQKLFLDKLKSKKKDTTTTETTTTTTNGVGEVKYFNYPAKADDIDLSEMEKYEKELEKSAQNYKQENPSNDNVNGLDADLMDVNKRII